VVQTVAVCCSVLQCVAECCGVLHCAAVYCSVLPCSLGGWGGERPRNSLLDPRISWSLLQKSFALQKEDTFSKEI